MANYRAQFDLELYMYYYFWQPHGEKDSFSNEIQVYTVVP